MNGGQDWEAVGASHADLFVNDENHKLPVYVFPLPDVCSWREDVFSFLRTYLWAYVYPLVSIMSQSLEFIEESRARSAWPPQSGCCNHGSTGCWNCEWFCHSSCLSSAIPETFRVFFRRRVQALRLRTPS